MKWKIGIILILFVIISIGIGCISEKTASYDLKYNLQKDAKFTYDVQYFTKLGHFTTITPMNIEMMVLNTTDDVIYTETEIESITHGNKTASEYTVKMTRSGIILKSNSTNLAIPEIQPELPNMIQYPGKMIKRDEMWSVPVKNAEDFTSLEGLKMEYVIEGTKNYTCLGPKKVSVKGGEFGCIGVKSEINFTLNISNSNRTEYTSTTGYISGESWIDSKEGFLVISTYNVDKWIKLNLSSPIYKEMGFERIYREMHTNAQMTSKVIIIE